MYKKGELVKLKGGASHGVIISINNDIAKVNINGKNVYISCDKIESYVENTSRAFLAKVPNTNNLNVAFEISNNNCNEITVRHQHLYDAMQNVDKFIDNAICNKIPKVKIIHGKGGGILRKEIHKYLKSHPSVKSFELGDHFEGQYGVTIVYLK